MSRTRWQEPNLARTPFVNERPVRRLGFLLWALFLIVAGLSIWTSLSIRRATATQSAELERLNRETASARERAATLETELRGADLPAQNERTEFINRRLAERAFSWSRLLETLTETMPRGVRLIRLSPEGFTRERARGAASVRTPATTRVALRITGEAEETEALLELVDRLFQHPAFHRPNLSRESEKKDFKIQFELTVAYLPEVANELAGVTAAGPIGAATPSTGTGALARGSVAAAPTAGVPATSFPTAFQPPATPATPATAAAGATRGSAGVEKSAAGQRPMPQTGPRSAARDGGRATVEQQEAESAASGEGAGANPTASSRFAGGPAGGLAGRPGTAVPGGSVPAAPPAAPPGSGAEFPTNVMPTPLRPYASATGGGR